MPVAGNNSANASPRGRRDFRVGIRTPNPGARPKPVTRSMWVKRNPGTAAMRTGKVTLSSAKATRTFGLSGWGFPAGFGFRIADGVFISEGEQNGLLVEHSPPQVSPGAQIAGADDLAGGAVFQRLDFQGDAPGAVPHQRSSQ